MSHVRVWIHAVWGTKRREHLLTKEIRPHVLAHIRQNARLKQIHIDAINGTNDYIHCLFGLNADMAVARAMQLIKGEAAHWINAERITSVRFEWANEYYATSVSESQLNRVRAYISNQEEHHRKLTFEEEVVKFLQNHNQRHG